MFFNLRRRTAGQNDINNNSVILAYYFCATLICSMVWEVQYISRAIVGADIFSHPRKDTGNTFSFVVGK